MIKFYGTIPLVLLLLVLLKPSASNCAVALHWTRHACHESKSPCRIEKFLEMRSEFLSNIFVSDMIHMQKVNGNVFILKSTASNNIHI